MNRDYSILIEKLKEWNIPYDDEKLKQLDKYFELLISWNEKMNLTSIIEFDDVIRKHFIDSLSIAQKIDMSGIDNMIDIGTGAGFPGVPIKIFFPNIKVTLLDSLNKRLIFLNTVIDELHLSDIETVHGRAEDVSREKNRREKYDLCVSRAVANLSTLCELCTPFIKVKGLFVSYKSEKVNEEIDNATKALKTLNCNIKDSYSFDLFSNSRTLLLISKSANTPAKYPRKAGTPAKDPL